MTRSNQSLHTDGSRITIFWDTTSHQRPPRVSSLVGDRSSRNMSGEYDLKLDRIRKLLDASHGQGWAFVPRAPLTEQTLVEWEAEYGVALPDDYRLFLGEIADGGVMPGSYCDFVVTPLAGVRGSET